MDQTDVQPVLRCARCKKPFDKQSSLKRHGYYCQSKQRGALPRSRACSSCAARKARCDDRRPACSRCLTRGITCHYPAGRSTGETRRVQQNDNTPASWNEPTSSPATSPTEVDASPETPPENTISDDAYALPDLPEQTSIVDVAGLDFDEPGYDIGNLLDSAAKGYEALLLPPPPSSALVHQPVPATQLENLPWQFDTLADLSIPRQPSQTIPSLLQRPKSKTAAQRIANLVLCTMKSYPLMISRYHTVPPFVHPRLAAAGVPKEDMEPLDNCTSLLHMINARGRGSQKLFWRNVRMECERFCAEHGRFGKWELVAALQALAIYTFIRLDQGLTEYNNVDHLLIATVSILSQSLPNSNKSCDHDSTRSWRDWIYEESLRRLCVVYQILDLVIYWQPAALCHFQQTELIVAPLPSSRGLWEAEDETAWKVARAGYPSGGDDDDGRSTYALAKNGELVRFDTCDSASAVVGPMTSLDDISREPLRVTGNWDEWCAARGEIGGLVMLAAALASCASDDGV